VASSTIFNYTLVHRIERPNSPAPTSISPLSPSGESFVVSYADASVLIFDTRTGEEVVGMASQETYDGSPDTGVNVVVATATGFDTTNSVSPGRRGSIGEDDVVHSATGGEGGVEGVVIAGYEDKYIRFFDANSGMFPSPELFCPRKY
jgi:striatin 1/3/4